MCNSQEAADIHQGPHSGSRSPARVNQLFISGCQVSLVVAAAQAGGDGVAVRLVLVDLVTHGAQRDVQLVGAVGAVPLEGAQGGEQPEALQLRQAETCLLYTSPSPRDS